MEADPSMAFDTLRNSAFSAFLVGQQAARLMRENKPNANGTKGTIIFTNASAALKGYPMSFVRRVRAFIRDHYALGDARPRPPFSLWVDRGRPFKESWIPCSS
jgi:hypothetical protein